MTQDARPMTGGELWTPADLAAEVLATPGIEGITVSGGEPFAQAAGLAAMLGEVHAKRDLGVIVYSGYTHEYLVRRAQTQPGVAELLAMTDLLVHGPYIEALNNDASLKGSSNQGVFLNSARYAAHLPMYGAEYARRVEVHVETRETMLVGVPSRRQLAWWREEKHLAGGFPENREQRMEKDN
jgi:anaerobic ribonucleoside-triphosphate reductase activating protein